MGTRSKKKLRIMQTQSAIGSTVRQRRTLLGLGLGRIGRSVVVADSPATRGMIAKVGHLVVSEEQGDE